MPRSHHTNVFLSGNWSLPYWFGKLAWTFYSSTMTCKRNELGCRAGSPARSPFIPVVLSLLKYCSPFINVRGSVHSAAAWLSARALNNWSFYSVLHATRAHTQAHTHARAHTHTHPTCLQVVNSCTISNLACYFSPWHTNNKHTLRRLKTFCYSLFSPP